MILCKKLREEGRQLILGRKLPLVRKPDARGVLIKRLSRFLALPVERKEIGLYALLKAGIEIGFEYIAEDFPAVFRIRQQQLTEFALRDHGNLAELRAVYAEYCADRRVYIAAARHNAAVRQHKFSARRLFRCSGAAGLAALILRVAPDDIGFSGAGENELYLRRRLRSGEFGAQHGAFPSLAARRAEQREGDGVKERSLSRAGISSNEV